ncbi:MAG: MFS transporter [Planctomycetes bacterium]|nr:MFS transporter [Planctomycetota bacterium]
MAFDLEHHAPALRHRNFRLLWFGQAVSMTGSMMQNAAVLWHVSLLAGDSLKEKASALALVGLVKFAAIALFALFGGVIADAIDRRKLMLATQSAMALFALALAWLSWSGVDAVWPIYALTALTSAAGVIDGPARHALLPSLVPAHLFANAITLNTIVFHVAFVGGPALTGPVMQYLGLEWVYLVNALSFGAVIVALAAMRDLPEPTKHERGEVSLAAAWEGIRFVFRVDLIRSSMLLDFFATFFASAKALLPIYAQDILKVGESGYGWLYSAEAVGALLGALFLARGAERIQRRGPWLLVAVGVYGLATIGFGLATSFAGAFVALAVGGIADSVSIVLRNVIRQEETPDRLRGRMTSVNMIFFMGGPQLGEYEAGVVAAYFGAATSVISGGVACIAATAWLAWKTPALVAYRKRARDPSS